MCQILQDQVIFTLTTFRYGVRFSHYETIIISHILLSMLVYLFVQRYYFTKLLYRFKHGLVQNRPNSPEKSKESEQVEL